MCLLLAVGDWGISVLFHWVQSCGFLAGCGRLGLLISHSCQYYCSGTLTSFFFCCPLCCEDVTSIFSACFCPPPMPDICFCVGGLSSMLLFSGKIQEPLLGLISAYLAVGHPSWSCPWRNEHRVCPPSNLHPYMLCSNN